MARAPGRAVCPAIPGLLLLLLVVLVREVAVAAFSGDPAGPALVIPSEGEAKAMFLPLVLRTANSSRPEAAEGDYYGQRRWRQLKRASDQKQTTARMRLYDDLLTNGCCPPFHLYPDLTFDVTFAPLLIRSRSPLSLLPPTLSLRFWVILHSAWML